MSSMHTCEYTDVWGSCKPLLVVSRANEDISPLWRTDACLDLPKPACLQVQADLEKSHQTISELTLAELTVS